MIVDRRSAVRTILLQHRWVVLACIVIAAGAEVLNDFVDLNRPVFSFAAVGLLGTVLSISLVFRVNEAYARWWEARTLWGVIVNESRSWARQVLSLVSDGADPELHATSTRLIYRQIAYVNALRLRLREQTDPEALGPFLPSKDLADLAGSANAPTQILQQQACDLAALRSAGAIDAIAMHRFDTTLSLLTDAQGGCERIKTTIFPESVTFIARIFVWGIVVLIPASFLE
jgi:putative membrane protein